jgi:methionyl-tRNA synthetase
MLSSTLLYPFMPSVSEKIREQCNISRLVSLPQHFIQFLRPGHQINKVYFEAVFFLVSLY